MGPAGSSIVCPASHLERRQHPSSIVDHLRQPGNCLSVLAFLVGCSVLKRQHISLAGPLIAGTLAACLWTGVRITGDEKELVESAIAVGDLERDAQYNFCRMQGGSDAERGAEG